MKVIDLLNKIANGEEVPKKIKINGDTLDLENGKELYYRFQDKSSTLCFDWYIETKRLNDEIEIIEDKKIEKCKNYEEFESIDDYIEHLRIKINELIDEVNKLKEVKHE